MDSVRIKLESFAARAYAIARLRVTLSGNDHGVRVRYRRIHILARGWLIERARTKRLRAELEFVDSYLAGASGRSGGQGKMAVEARAALEMFRNANT